MRPLLLSVLFLGVVQAQANTSSLTAALAAAKEQAPVQASVAELEDAKANLARTLGDPLLTKPVQLQAEQRAALAQSNYDRSLAQAQGNIAGAYFQVLESQLQVRLTAKALEVATKGLEVAKIRQRNGSGTALDTRNAETRLDDSEANALRAKNGLELAEDSLKSLAGKFEALSPVTAIPAVPSDTALKTLIDKSPDMLQSRQRLALSQLQVELLDPSYASPSDIEAAKARSSQAAAGDRELGRALSLQYTSLLQNLQAAARTLRVQQTALANAQEALNNDRKRLGSGLISALVYLQSELTAIQASLAYQQAQGNYFRAWYALQTGGR
jgi:outer membrane protein, heavy metal efflux system